MKQISVTLATELAGGSEKVTRAWMIPIARILVGSKDGNVDEKNFLLTLENCLGVAARNVAENELKNQAAIDATTAKNAERQHGNDDDGHHHFAP